MIQLASGCGVDLLKILHIPTRLGALHALHVKHGAVMEETAGWQVVQNYRHVGDEIQAVNETAGANQR